MDSLSVSHNEAWCNIHLQWLHSIACSGITDLALTPALLTINPYSGFTDLALTPALLTSPYSGFTDRDAARYHVLKRYPK
jgi:hypothetical protein